MRKTDMLYILNVVCLLGITGALLFLSGHTWGIYLDGVCLALAIALLIGALRAGKSL